MYIVHLLIDILSIKFMFMSCIYCKLLSLKTATYRNKLVSFDKHFFGDYTQVFKM